MSTEIKLLPCPFCGAEAHRAESVNGSRLYIGCATCGALLKAALTSIAPGRVDWSRDITAVWNQRAALKDTGWISVKNRLPKVALPNNPPETPHSWADCRVFGQKSFGG
jgi:hypothetical protein